MRTRARTVNASLWLLGIIVTLANAETVQAQVKETTTTESREFTYASSTRVIGTQTEQDGRRIETSTLQEPSNLSGNPTLSGWVTLTESEQQTTKRDPNTTTVVKRLYGRDTNGKRRLVEAMEEQRTATADGRETVVRTRSSADVNDRLQVVERDVRETIPTSDNTREGTGTVTLYGSDGYAFEWRSRKLEQRRGDVAEQQTTVFGRDGNGNFVPNYRTESTTTKTASGQKKDERVLWDTGLGKMTVVQREVSSESEDAQGGRSITQTYYTLSSEPAGSLVLIQQVSTSRQRSPEGSRSKQQIERLDFGNPVLGLQLSSLLTETSQPTFYGETRHQIIRSADGNGHFPFARITDTHVTISWPAH